MSVADKKGYLSRWKLLKRKGHAPRQSGLSVSDSIDRMRAAQQREVSRAAFKGRK